MNFSQRSASHFVPILARILLCLVFVPTGWGYIMDESTFSGPQIQSLVELGVIELDSSADGQTPGTANPPQEVKARSLYNLAITLDEHKIPQPIVTAWAIAIIELIGGGLLLLGLFTRIFAFAVAVIMGFGFALISLPEIQVIGGPFGLPYPLLLQASAQLALGTLGLGLLFSGAGGLSIDSAIFSHGHKSSRRVHRNEEDDYEDEYGE
jgi:uncharacterized membrane protein YphA (DoxX/SURF4 family)